MKLSIIIPVYNAAPYLPKSIGSVLDAIRELDGPAEIICVNDGSTDNSADVLAELSGKDSRIKIITQKNSGVSMARNAGLVVAQGEWVHFMDSDDYLAPDFYSRVFCRVSETPDAEVVVTAMKSLYVDGTSRIPNGEMGVGVIEGDVLAQIFHTKRMGAAYCMADKICRRRLLTDNGIRFMTGLHSGEDSLCCQTVLAYAKCVVVDAENNGYCYWHHRGSLTTCVSLDKVKYQVNAVAENIALWQRTRKRGAFLFAHFGAAAVLFLGEKLSDEQQKEYVDFLVREKKFTKIILPFLVAHGSHKSRVVGTLLWILPTSLRGWMLKHIRRARHG